MTEAAELRVDAIQVAGVYVPLAYVQPADPTLGGYQWLDWTDNGQTRHPGVDLNSLGGGDADLGAPVLAAVDGVVTYLRYWDGVSTGYGSYVVLETDDARATPPVWLKHCHLDMILVDEGQRVLAGEALGTCGKSGNQPMAHLHWEVLWKPTANWGVWPYGWSVAQIQHYWMRPADWFFATVATAARQQGGGADVAILDDMQQAAIQKVIWGPYWDDEAAQFAIPASWRAEWMAGRWRGAPLAAEQAIPASDEKPGGSFQVFQAGCAAWLPGQEVSWEA